MSEKTKNLYQKLCEFQGLGLTFEKNGIVKSRAFSYGYTTLDEINKKIKPELSKLGLFLSHSISDTHVTTTITDVLSGDCITSTCSLPNLSDPQKRGSAITYFKRYNTTALLNLDSEDDDDGTATKNAKVEKKPFSKEAQEKLKDALFSEKYTLPETVEELYTDLEKRYTLTDEQKEGLKSFYITKDSDD